MSKLEDFVKNNREDFDKFEPGPVVWHNIQQELKRPAEKKGILISINFLRWSAAAVILLMLGTGAYYFFNKKNATQEIVKTKEQPKTNDLPVVTPRNDENKKPVVAETTKPIKRDQKSTEPQTATDDTNEELYHYAKLIELKQNEIKKIKTDEPLLYKQFAADFNKLDSTFHILKKQLPANPNREQILEAMIQNLQYQEGLLNQQLNIIKKINNTKKEAYEKAYKSA